MNQKIFGYTALENDEDEFFLRELTALLDSDDEFAALLNIPAGSGRVNIKNEKEEQKTPGITDRQLRALTKKHLLMMIRDLETELVREKGEKENLLLAYRAALTLSE